MTAFMNWCIYLNWLSKLHNKFFDFHKLCSFSNNRVWLFSHTASSLECYHCQNSTSWESCKDNLKEVTCPESFKRCFKATITTQNNFKNISRSVFARGCADRCDASGILHCDEHVICDAYCCTADLCNMSPAMTPSKILSIFIAVLVACIFWVQIK